MSRKSTAALSIVGADGVVETLKRPKAPAELTLDEANEWRELINVLPADQYSPDVYPVLIQLCRHKVNARRLSDMKQDYIGKKDIAGELGIMKLEEEQSRVIAMLMTKLRLTPQSRYDAKKKRGPTSKKPWES